ncbi:MAG: 4Fe-4S dicluster domain-containing protein [Desulfobacteraceae bacterium]|nr:4Fe-4S dicluster domain-containing protein [Desulfobacteraceae bacterium]
MHRKNEAPQSYIRPEQPDPALERVREKVRTCIQCGTCTGSCPNAFAMDATPRKLWRLVLMGQSREIFESHTFALCSDCYCCTLRCPRGLALTDAMADLKQIAAAEKHGGDPACTAFYRAFLRSARRYGRVQETRLMASYLAVMTPRRPLMPFRFSGLGLQMIKRGKISLRRPAGSRNLEGIFARIESRRGGQ